MKNLTITVDEETAAWARVHAARQNMSVSRMVGELLDKHRRDHLDYDRAMRRYLSRRLVTINRSGGPYPTRDSLHDRDGLR